LQSLLEDRLQRLVQIGINGGGSSAVGPTTQVPIPPTPPITPTTPPAPTGLSLDTGFSDTSSWIDVTWITVAPVDPDPVVEYEVMYGPTAAGTTGAVRVAEPPVRLEPVIPGVEYTVFVRAISRFGVSSPLVGPEVIVAAGDTGVPAQATGLSVAAAIRTLTAVWNENAEPDVVDGHGSYDVQIATDVGFTTGLRGQRISGTIVSFADLVTGVTYYVRVRAVDSSGNEGAWSAVANATTGQVVSGDIFAAAITNVQLADNAVIAAKIATDAVTSPAIQAAAITTAKIANLAVTTALIDAAAVTTAKIANLAVTTALIDDAAITNAKIANLAVDNAKIAALAVDSAKIADAAITTVKIGDAQITSAKIISITADKIAAGSITAATITISSAGVLRAGRTSTPFHYMLFDSNGIRMWKSGSAAFTGGTLSLEANVATGNISMVGVITATTLTLTGSGTIQGSLAVTGDITITTGNMIWQKGVDTWKLFLHSSGPLQFMYGVTPQAWININGAAQFNGLVTCYGLTLPAGTNLIVTSGTSTLNGTVSVTGQIHSTDWFRASGAKGLYVTDYGQGIYSAASGVLRTYGTGTVFESINGTNNNWSHATIRALSTGNLNVAYAWEQPTFNACWFWLGTDNIMRIQDDSNTWLRVDCDVNDFSKASSKRDIVPLVTSEVLGKIKRLRPIKFKRKPPDTPRSREKEQEILEGRWAPEILEAKRKYLDEEWVGFTAEEMAAVFPEVVAYNHVTGEADGIRYRLMVAPLVGAIQELTAQLEAVMAIPAVASALAKGK
jgi:hypothetical protein